MSDYIWPDVFSSAALADKTDAQLLSAGLVAWGNSMAGAPIPASFGDMMAGISERLGIIGTPESFSAKADKWIAERRNK